MKGIINELIRKVLIPGEHIFVKQTNKRGANCKRNVVMSKSLQQQIREKGKNNSALTDSNSYNQTFPLLKILSNA